jgi:hypothetical protein
VQAVRILVVPAVFLVSCGGAAGDGEDASSSSTTSSSSTGGETPTSSSTQSAGSSTGEASDGTSSTSTGEPLAETWIQRFGAPESQHPGGLGFNGNGDLWVAGDVYGGIDLGAGSRAPAGTGVYLARYAPTGEALRVQRFGPASGEATLTQVSGLVVDGTGAVIVTGWLEGTYTLGGSELSADEVDFYVAKWDAAGEPVWGQKFGGADWQVSYAIALGPDDSLWLGGAALAPFTMGDIMLGGAASTGMFVARLAADGTPLQGQWWGEAGDQEIRGIAVCADDSLAIGGFFDNDSLQFGAEQVGTVGDKDMFVARLDPKGAPTWIRGYGSASVDYVAQVACTDEVAFAGVATGMMQVGEVVLTPNADADVVLGRLALDGTLAGAAAITGPEDQLPTGLVALPDGHTAVVLTSAGTVTLGDVMQVSAGDSDVVFASYAPGATSPSQLVGVGDGDTQRSGPLAVHGAGVVALAGALAGTATWPGLAPVTAAGPEDLLLVRFTPGS